MPSNPRFRLPVRSSQYPRFRKLSFSSSVQIRVDRDQDKYKDDLFTFPELLSSICYAHNGRRMTVKLVSMTDVSPWMCWTLQGSHPFDVHVDETSTALVWRLFWFMLQNQRVMFVSRPRYNACTFLSFVFSRVSACQRRNNEALSRGNTPLQTNQLVAGINGCIQLSPAAVF